MTGQIENTPDGYIVGVYMVDERGHGQWLRLRNFGDREGDAIEFLHYDLPTFDITRIKMFAKTFDITRKYARKRKDCYVKID